MWLQAFAEKGERQRPEYVVLEVNSLFDKQRSEAVITALQSQYGKDLLGTKELQEIQRRPKKYPYLQIPNRDYVGYGSEPVDRPGIAGKCLYQIHWDGEKFFGEYFTAVHDQIQMFMTQGHNGGSTCALVKN